MFGRRILGSLARRMLAVPATGIDISDRSVKFIRFKKSGGYLRVDAHGTADVEEGVVVGGEIKKPDALISVLRKLPLGGRLKERFGVVSLPEEKGFVRVIQVPRIKLADLYNALQWELEGNIPLPPEEIYFDYEVIESGATPDHINILTVAFPRAIVDMYASVLTEAGVKPLALELESQSIARALVDRARLSDAVIIFDIGASRTSIVLTQYGSLVFTSTIQISGNALNQAISRALGVSIEEAESIKKTAGLRPDQHEGKVFEALQPILLSLVEELEKHMHFYHDHPSGPGQTADIQKIVCTGGDASLVGLDAYLAKALHTPVMVGDPFVSISSLMGNQRPPLPRNISLQFSTAVGLALREIDVQ